MRRWAERWRAAARRIAATLAQAARLAVGIPDYAAYCEHVRRAHPDRLPMDRTTFFRERVEARYGRGRSRCC
ncbi:YbdD/YjiX family protein [Cognatilysobacter segetis]|uniref:YbdD/YjiX family protein n=1 Tax=Cognatilysobacter segetis TaxID=2492394 RepID=UPI00106041E0|nr:YbdD/YjiX family protein [Lysobacter segetis]